MPWALRITESSWFGNTIIFVIVLNAIVIGLDTSPALASQYGDWFHFANQLFLTVYIVEALIKMAAFAPRVQRYFQDGWNLFDFSIIVISLIPATGQLATLARLARLLRVLRLVSALPELRLIVATLVRSIPSMAHVLGGIVGAQLAIKKGNRLIFAFLIVVMVATGIKLIVSSFS